MGLASSKYHWAVQRVIFYFPHSFHIHRLEFFWNGNLSLLPSLFIYLIIYLYQFYSWILIIYFEYEPTLLYFVAQIAPLVSLCHPPMVVKMGCVGLSIFLHFGIQHTPVSSCILPAPILELVISDSRALENGIKNQDLGTKFNKIFKSFFYCHFVYFRNLKLFFLIVCYTILIFL